MIMLITALLISGGASAILIGQWSETVRTLQQQERAADLEDEVGVSIAGDLAMVNFVGSTNTMTLYFVNTGEHDLSTSSYEVLVNGVAPNSKSETVLPSGTDWEPGLLLEVELVHRKKTFKEPKKNNWCRAIHGARLIRISLIVTIQTKNLSLKKN